MYDMYEYYLRYSSHPVFITASYPTEIPEYKKMSFKILKVNIYKFAFFLSYVYFYWNELQILCCRKTWIYVLHVDEKS